MKAVRKRQINKEGKQVHRGTSGDGNASALFAMTSSSLHMYIYRPSLVKCRSTVIYLSRIDASPEVNGRVVTISPRTGQFVRSQQPCVRIEQSEGVR